MLDWKSWIKNWLYWIICEMQMQFIDFIHFLWYFPVLLLIPWDLCSGIVKYFQLLFWFVFYKIFLLALFL